MADVMDARKVQTSLEQELRPQDYPGAVDVTRYAEALELFRSPTALTDPMSSARYPYTGETLNRINGPAHQLRRRTMNRLLRRGGHTWYRDTVVVPAVDRAIAEVRRAMDADGVVRVDLVLVAKRLVVQLGAGLLGLERAKSEEGTDELLELIRVMEYAQAKRLRPEAEGGPTTEPPPEAVEQGLAAKRAYVARFFRPAFAAHQEMLARHNAGELAESDLPHDLMMLLVAHADPSWVDEDLAVRETLVPLLAITVVETLCATVDDLSRWFALHPEDEPRRTDGEFLLRAFSESLRLHPTAPAFMRRAAEDMTLCYGTKIRGGQWAILRVEKANLDESVYGPDSGVFNPWRQVPEGAYPYGLSFGSGPHMCYGQPLVLGNEGIDGSSLYILKSLYVAGARPDPLSPPRRSRVISHTFGNRYESYPLVFERASVS